jgi:hypothetical protein
LSDSFLVQSGLKQGDALTRLLFNFALENAIRKVQENRMRLKLNGTHHLMVYADAARIYSIFISILTKIFFNDSVKEDRGVYLLQQKTVFI